MYNKCSVKVRDDDEEEEEDLSQSASIGQSFIPNQQRAADFCPALADEWSWFHSTHITLPWDPYT